MDYTNAVSGGHPVLSTTKKNQNALALLNFVRIDVSFETDRYRDQSFGSRRSLRENLEDGNFRCKVIFGYNRERERERESVYVGVRECVHVCVCAIERKREREREGRGCRKSNAMELRHRRGCVDVIGFVRFLRLRRLLCY